MSEWFETPESSNVARFKYDEVLMVLTVEFKNGVLYSYFDVSKGLYDALRDSPSKGQFLAAQVKGTHRYARL